MATSLARADQSRFDAWRQDVSRVCGGVMAEAAADQPFIGRVRVRPLADVDVVEHYANARRVFWDAKDVRRAELAFGYLILHLEGRARIEQCGREVSLNPGDAVIVDSARPADLRFDGLLHQVCFHFPRALFTARATDGDVPYMTAFRATPGSGAVVTAFARSLYDNADAFGAEAALLRNSLLDLLTAAMPTARPGTREGLPSTLQRLMALIEQQLADPELSPGRVAERAGVSLRHAHRLFGQAGLTMGEWIRSRRLMRARDALASPQAAHRSILDIAFGCGFNDAAHFSRTFRARFGQSPRLFRKSALYDQQGAVAHVRRRQLK